MILPTITSNLIQKDILKDSDKVKFQFGLEVLLHNLAIFISCICIGLFLHLFWETVLFLIVFPTLHQYFHGLHAETKARCYIGSVCIYCIGIWAYLFLNVYILQIFTFLVFLLTSLIIIRENLYSSSLMSLPLSRTPYAFFVVCFLIGNLGVSLTDLNSWKMLLIAILLSGGDYLIMKKMDRKTKLFNLKMLLSSCMAFVVAFGVYVAPRACYGWGYEFEIPEELK